MCCCSSEHASLFGTFCFHLQPRPASDVTVQPWLPLNHDPPTLTSLVLGLQVCAAASGFVCLYLWVFLKYINKENLPWLRAYVYDSWS